MGKFRIKISPSWFSEDFIVFKYSTNGIFWKKIKECKYDTLSEWFYMSTKTSDFNEAEYLLQKFKTLEDVINFENEQKQKVVNNNKEILEKKEKHKKKRNDIYKKYS